MHLEEKIKIVLNSFEYKTEIVNNLMYLLVNNSDLQEVLLKLKNISFQVLIDCFAINKRNDNESNIIYYHLLSYKYNQSICIYTNVINKSIQSIIEIFENANWYEREIYEMYNINFIGHNNLKKLFNEI